ncbi:MAG: DUF928 domain-containing protein [Symploca sp. SIO1A3]|nr:DUF928 domain-containing protein [Symploca sp. SIO1A3]
MMFRQQLPIAFAITLGMTSLINPPTSAQIQHGTLLSQTRPDPPPTPPDNQGKPGGGLDPSDSACKSKTKPLTALIPIKNPVLTTSEHPTFLFYVPDQAEDVRLGEFYILTQDEKKWVYKTRFKLPQTPGIISISLPSLPETSLEDNQYYHWYFKLYCQDNTTSKADLDVNGWVQKVELTAERKRQIEAAEPDIWYDVVANVAERLRTSPDDSTLKHQWLNLLRLIEAEDLAEEPLVGSVVLLEEEE